MYPGTLNRHQGVDIAIRAFAKVADQMPDAQFHIYGEGPSKQDLIDLTETLGLTGRVIIRDFLPTNEIADVMATSDLAVVPKRASSLFGNEAASTKIAEFMSLGVPLIVSRTKVDMFYYDDSLVKFFESENESDLADCMLLLWRDQRLRARLATNASRYIWESGWQEKHTAIYGWFSPWLAGARTSKCIIRRQSSGLRFDRAISVRLMQPVPRLLPGRRDRRESRYLMYHGIQPFIGTDHPYFETNISPALFASHMELLSSQGYKTVTLREANEALLTGRA